MGDKLIMNYAFDEFAVPLKRCPSTIICTFQVEEFKSRNLQLGKELEEQQIKLSRVKKLNDKAATEVRLVEQVLSSELCCAVLCYAEIGS